jgi:benzoyl-CoA reductase/2-hydroxyglutaryl-CoA dehydratase subunit BcrC/BadD/HgdB
MSEAKSETVDLEKLAAELEERSEETEELRKSLAEVPLPAAAESDDLIKNVAANLATINEASGGRKNVAHFEEQIKLRQRSR